jgi:hypothetical protein
LNFFTAPGTKQTSISRHLHGTTVVVYSKLLELKKGIWQNSLSL